MTYEAAARAVRRVAAENGEILRTNKSAVAHWVDGALPSGRTGQYLAEAISRRVDRVVTTSDLGLEQKEPIESANADPVLAATKLGRVDLERRQLLAAAVFTVANVAVPLDYDHDKVGRILRARSTLGVVGEAEIEVVRSITATFSAADEILGGGHGLTTVAAYLADSAAPMLRARFRSDRLRRRAFGAVAELAYLAGWKHHDLGHEGAAQRYYLAGYQLACEADPHGHAAWMMRALAHQALSLKQPQHCADLIDNALRRSLGHVDGQTQALLYITQARAYSFLRDRSPAARALVLAENSLSRTDEPQPLFSAVAGPAAGTVASHTARALTDLGDHLGTERQHRDALVRWDPVKYKRVHVLTHADLGDSLAAQGKADEAVGAWTKALDLTEDIVSDRVRKAISSISPTLATYSKRGVPGSSELRRRIFEASR
ncbi:hypothetical protein [Kribbella antibiotica]|uniref:hypothetical protein n=1 Tax=Kribbella antibiotica TaxID=190195 RepID=UPI00192DBFB8|nr:hypothetical protein [Kribbella antibiotica]